MRPDFEKINERMEQAALSEFMPDFDKAEEWRKLSGRLSGRRKKKLVWLYAAALVLIAGTGLTWLLLNLDAQPRPVSSASSVPVKTDTAATQSAIHDTDRFVKATHARAHAGTNNEGAKKYRSTHRSFAMLDRRMTKNVICNGTPCPLEIYISQTMRCPNAAPTTISSCSRLEPDQAGKLSFEGHDKVARNCSLTISEIEIKSVETGEAILLTANSSPVTAQEVFGYITGQKEGDILAGMFNSDCDHNSIKHDLRLNSGYGGVIIQ